MRGDKGCVCSHQGYLRQSCAKALTKLPEAADHCARSGGTASARNGSLQGRKAEEKMRQKQERKTGAMTQVMAQAMTGATIGAITEAITGAE